jgi:hypothetical protein
MHHRSKTFVFTGKPSQYPYPNPHIQSLFGLQIKQPRISFNLKVFGVKKYDFLYNLSKVSLPDSDNGNRRSGFTLEG